MAAPLLIPDKDLAPFKGKAVLVTGGSSGMGLAMAKIVLEHGGYVVSGDINPPPIEDANLTFLKTDVTSWSDLTNLFKLTIEKHKRVDHCFANAGIPTRADYINGTIDDKGNLVEPTNQVFDINLRGCINTCALAIHHMKKQDHAPGETSSIAITASASSFQRFRLVDYTAAKHGVFGFMRGLVPLLYPQLPIRINCIGPSWTTTALVPNGAVEKIAGIDTQTPADGARSAAILMADASRHGQFIYSVAGKYWEIEHAVLLPAAEKFVGPMNEDVVMEMMLKAGAIGHDQRYDD